MLFYRKMASVIGISLPKRGQYRDLWVFLLWWTPPGCKIHKKLTFYDVIVGRVRSGKEKEAG